MAHSEIFSHAVGVRMLHKFQPFCRSWANGRLVGTAQADGDAAAASAAGVCDVIFQQLVLGRRFCFCLVYPSYLTAVCL